MPVSKNAASARKGKAVEHLVAAFCVLATEGELNALTALVDDEGVDLGLKRRNGTRTLDVQVKARFSDEDGSAQLRRGRFIANVRLETFRPRDDLYILYVAVNGGTSHKHSSLAAGRPGRLSGLDRWALDKPADPPKAEDQGVH